MAQEIKPTALPAICAELGIHDDNGLPLVNSSVVAEKFGKQHQHVLRDIDRILHGPSLDHENSEWFREIYRAHPTVLGRMDRSFDLTKDGLMLLVFGWTGAKAMTLKVKYIEAFNTLARMVEDHRRELVRGLDPTVIGGVVKAVMNKLAETHAFGISEDTARKLFRKMIDDDRASQGRQVIDGWPTSLDLAIKYKAVQKGRRGLVIKLTSRMRNCANTEGVRIDKNTAGTWIFPKEFAERYMTKEGISLIVDHNARMAGQGIFKLEFPEPAPPASGIEPDPDTVH